MTIDLAAAAIGIALLLLLSAFFSGSETGLTAASAARIHHLARRGNKRARVVNELRERKERLIGAILLGNNLVNIFASALATGAMIRVFGEAGVAYATVAMTALVVVFGEVLPKTYAINHPDRVALATAPALRLVTRLFAPVTQAVQAVVELLLLAGGGPRKRRALVSPAEELRSSIDLHARSGGIVKRERDMLGSILDLSALAVSEIMVHRKNMEMIDVGQPQRAVIDQVLANRHTRLPLWRGDPENIVGVLHVKDLVRELAKDGFSLEQLDIAAVAAEPWFIPETTTLREQLDAFRQRRAHFALVVDEYGSLRGLVTLEDILEEIVGDIRDEHDAPVAGLRQDPDGSLVVDGTVSIRDLNRQFDWSLPDDEATTIAGLVIHEARIIPETGRTFAFHGFKFEVLRRQRNQITALRITPLDRRRPAPPAAVA